MTKALLIVLCFVLASTGRAQALKQSALEAVVNRYVEKQGFSGNILVTKDHTVLLKNNRGTSDINKGFLLASVTKQFVATLILRQVEQKKLNLDDYLIDLLPRIPEAWKAIQLKNLLNHTSGVPDYFEFADIEVLRKAHPTQAQLLTRIQKERLLFSPGKGYAYSNSGYLILGLILERVTGKNWSRLAKEELWTPLQMNHTGIMKETPVRGTDISYDDPSLLFSVGDVYSNLEDLLIWEIAFFSSDSILQQKTKIEMMTPNAAGYGFGLRINQKFGDTVVWHSGHLNGHTCIMEHWVDSNTNVIILTNLDKFDATKMANELFYTTYFGGVPTFSESGTPLISFDGPAELYQD